MDMFKGSEGKMVVDCFLANCNIERSNVILYSDETGEIKLNLNFQYKWLGNEIHIKDKEFEINIEVNEVWDDDDYIGFGDWVLGC